MTKLSEENKGMKESILDIQARSKRDNLIFSGIPEQEEEDPEAPFKKFLQKQLELPVDTVKNISFHWVHRLGRKQPDSQHQRPIVAKFEHFKQKELVKSQGQELRGTDFSMKDQFPREILEHCRCLFPIRKSLWTEDPRLSSYCTG